MNLHSLVTLVTIVFSILKITSGVKSFPESNTSMTKRLPVL